MQKKHGKGGKGKTNQRGNNGKRERERQLTDRKMGEEKGKDKSKREN